MLYSFSQFLVPLSLFGLSFYFPGSFIPLNLLVPFLPGALVRSLLSHPGIATVPSSVSCSPHAQGGPFFALVSFSNLKNTFSSFFPLKKYIPLPAFSKALETPTELEENSLRSPRFFLIPKIHLWADCGRVCPPSENKFAPRTSQHSCLLLVPTVIFPHSR